MAIVEQPVHGGEIKRAYASGKNAAMAGLARQQYNADRQRQAHDVGVQRGSLAMANAVQSELRKAGLGQPQQPQAEQAPSSDVEKVAQLITAAKQGNEEAAGVLQKLAQDPKGREMVLSVAQQMDSQEQDNSSNEEVYEKQPDNEVQEGQSLNTPQAGLSV